MKNLLSETIEVLKENGKAACDVLWVGSYDGKYAISWDEFAAIANIGYDDSLGYQKVATDLVVVGDTWWLNRFPFGLGYWEYNTVPVRSDSSTPFNRVAEGFSSALERMN